jgi:hypothetical protein
MCLSRQVKQPVRARVDLNFEVEDEDAVLELQGWRNLVAVIALHQYGNAFES